MMKRLVLLVGIALLSFAFAAAASAASAKTPFHGSFHDDLSFNYACPGTVLLHEEGVEDGRVTVYFDREGTPISVVVHHHLRGVITNAAGETFIDGRIGRTSST
jgi:hypothetical protein